MNIEAEEILSPIKTTNLTGAWNALNFLARNWDENATVEDLAEAIHWNMIRLEEE